MPDSAFALQRSRTVASLLALEDESPAFLAETLPGAALPLWPQLRVAFGLALSAKELDEPAQADAVAQARGAWRLAGALLPSRWDARGWRGSRDVLFVTTGGSTFSADGHEVDWLVGDFADAVPDRSLVLNWGTLPSRHGPPAFASTRSLRPVMARSALAGLLTRIPDASVRRIEAVVAEAARRLGLEDEREQARLVRTAVLTERLRPGLQRRLVPIIDRVAPKVVLMQNASYGGQANVVQLLRSAGVRVVEPQHGWIGPSHYAYNHGAAMRAPELRAGLPDELLTFGTFWSDGVQHAATSTAIGRAHLEARARQAPDRSARDRAVLLVSAINDPAGSSDFALRLRDRLPDDWTVRYRPHPSERASFSERYPRLVDADRVEVDLRPDVYDSLAAAPAVVGAASTVLYEALAMGCRVFPLESPKGPYYVGSVFGPRLDRDAAAEIIAAELLAGGPPDAGRPELLSRIWRPGAVGNFLDWLQRV